MRKGIFLCLPFMLSGMAFTCGCAKEPRPSPALQVVIIPSTTNVSVWEQPFNLAVRIENRTQTDQTIRVLRSAWPDQWQSSNKKVSRSLVLGGRMQSEEVVAIPPSGAYTNALEVWIDKRIADKRLSFRMGFTSSGSAKTLWSNQVELHILPPDTWWDGRKYYRDRNRDGKIDWEVSGETWMGHTVGPVKAVTNYYRDRNRDGKIDWEVSGETWMGHTVGPVKTVTNADGGVVVTAEYTGQGVDTYKVDTNYDGFYDLAYGAGGTNDQIQWTKPIHERVPALGKGFVEVEKESWMDRWIR